MAGESLREKVFQKIRDDILKGRYKKGDELVECTIGGELGVSRTPVREAIRQLALEGLVQISRGRGGSRLTEQGVRFCRENQIG